MIAIIHAKALIYLMIFSLERMGEIYCHSVFPWLDPPLYMTIVCKWFEDINFWVCGPYLYVLYVADNCWSYSSWNFFLSKVFHEFCFVSQMLATVHASYQNLCAYISINYVQNKCTASYLGKISLKYYLW